MDLSHPKGHSVNDGIPKRLCSLSYITVDDAIDHIIQTGPRTLLAKIRYKERLSVTPSPPSRQTPPGNGVGEQHIYRYLSAVWATVRTKVVQCLSRDAKLDCPTKWSHTLNSLPR